MKMLCATTLLGLLFAHVMRDSQGLDLFVKVSVDILFYAYHFCYSTLCRKLEILINIYHIFKVSVNKNQDFDHLT